MTTTFLLLRREGEEEGAAKTEATVPCDARRITVEPCDGDLARVINEAVASVTTEFVCILEAGSQVTAGMLDFLESLIWDSAVTFPTLIVQNGDGRPVALRDATQSCCPVRLAREPFIPSQALYRTEALRRVPVRRSDELWAWDVQKRLVDGGWRLKGVPEARVIAPVDVPRADVEPAGTPPVVFYHQLTPASTYVRCAVPARALGGFISPWPRFEVADNAESLDFTGHPPAAIWQFPGDRVRAVTMDEMRERGIRVLVEVDDNYATTVKDFNPGWAKGNATIPIHRKIVEHLSDGIVCSTEEIAKRYRGLTRTAYICPNGVDPFDWIDQPPPSFLSEEAFRVGYSASHSHIADVKQIAGALEWASRQPGVQVVVMGVNPGFKFPHVRIPWSNDLGVYRALIKNLDVGLAPLVPNDWTNCRSDLKALEYAMADVCPILSEAAPYKGWKDGEGCLKASNPSSWRNQIRNLVRHRGLAAELAAQAREYVMAERTNEAQAHYWQEAIDGAVA